MSPPRFFNGSPHFSIGFPFVFQYFPLCFLMGPPCFLMGPFILVWVFPSFLMDPLHSSIGSPLLLLLVSPLFLFGSPLFSNGVPCFPMCSPLFSNAFPLFLQWPPFIILWVFPRFLMDPLDSSIGFPLFSCDRPSFFYLVLLRFPMCSPLCSHFF